MAKASEIENPELREKMETAFAAMRAGKGGDAVHAIAETFLRYIELNPGSREQTVAARGGRRMARLMRWPNLGANMDLASVREGKPQINFTRERFSSAEALTYYQFVLDEVLAAQRGAEAAE